ncbi:MAG: PEP-CTERM sorting domain-containing protein [Planctomycetota bacterium]|jgi:hypothetical protein
MRGVVFLSCAILALSLPARADPVDFRDGAVFAPAKDQASFHVTVPVDEVQIELKLEASPAGARLWWDAVDGFGVRYSYEDDEIEDVEILGVHFSELVLVDRIHVADLFFEHGYAERGWYQLDDGPKIPFSAVPGSPNGELILDIGTAAGTILFSAPGRTGGQNHEFAVSGLDLTPNPEPGTFILFGSACAGAWVARRLRRRRRRSEA